jgi:hypothetical protein
MKRFIAITAFCMFAVKMAAQDTIRTDSESKEYSFIFQDSPAALFTMRQSNENFLTLYRLGIGEINRYASHGTSALLQIIVQSCFFQPLTHEEGHRSILTNEGIGSVSRPYYNSHLAAYVTGVTDAELISLRNNNLPVFTRMYTAGLESDYALAMREGSLLNWQKEDMSVLWVEYFFRKFGLISYYGMALFKYNMNLAEDANELDRDIAGHDVYGAIHSLHHPEDEFQRYVDYKDLQPEEQKFAKRVGWRSLLNVIDPVLWTQKGFTIKEKYIVNFALGYTMAPFGDFIDEHFWLKTKSLNSHFYFRQYENKSNWFPALGADFADLPVFRRVSSNIAIHGWIQPKNLSFTQKNSDLGGAVDVLLKYRFLSLRKGNLIDKFSINVGLTAKTKGFLPEEVVMDKHFGVRLGASVWL